MGVALSLAHQEFSAPSFRVTMVFATWKPTPRVRVDVRLGAQEGYPYCVIKTSKKGHSHSNMHTLDMK